MENYFLWVVMPNLDRFFSILGIIGLVFGLGGTIVFSFLYNDAYNESDKEITKKLGIHCTKVGLISILFIMICCFLPTKKDLMQLKVFSIISEIQGADKIPQKIVDKLNELLEIDLKEKANDNR